MTFDERFDKIRYADDAEAAARRDFTRDELVAWIAAKARQETDFGYPYEPALRIFPRSWWQEALDEIVRARLDAPGAQRFVRALLTIDPHRFDATPREALAWRLGFARTTSILTGAGPAALADLRAAAASASEPLRWTCAAHLLLLDPSRETLAWVESMLDPRATAPLRALGFEARGGRVRRLWPVASYHLVADGDGPTVAFGGLAGRVARHHVLTLDPVPADLELGVRRLVLAVSLDELLEEGIEHYYRHAENGDVVTSEDEPDVVGPALRESRVALVRSSPEMRFQSWGEASSGDNLDRLGGCPVFVQDPAYPKCSDCEQTMVHLLSLDSRWPLESGDTLAWGSGGVANAFFCSRCRVSCWTWACT